MKTLVNKRFWIRYLKQSDQIEHTHTLGHNYPQGGGWKEYFPAKECFTFTSSYSLSNLPPTTPLGTRIFQLRCNDSRAISVNSTNAGFADVVNVNALIKALNKWFNSVATFRYDFQAEEFVVTVNKCIFNCADNQYTLTIIS